MAKPIESSSSPGDDGGTSSDAPISEKLSQVADQAREKVGQMTDAIRNADTQEVVRKASDYARSGGRAAYDTLRDHPLASALLGAMLGYALYFGMRPDESYSGQARSHARAAHDRLKDVDWDEMQDEAKKYARRERRETDEVSHLGILPLLAVLGLAYWLFSGGSQTAQNNRSSDRPGR